MKKITAKDMVGGGMYFYENYIIVDFSTKTYITTNPNNFCYNANFKFSLNSLYEATEEQKQWLRACMEANKFIPLDQIKPKEISYEIY